MNPEVYFFDNIKDINLAEIEGIIAIGKFGPKQVEELTDINPLVVFVDYSPNEDKFDSIVIDFEKATTKIIDFFIATSHQEDWLYRRARVAEGTRKTYRGST